MDRFITRIPKTPQNAVINLINQIRAVPEVSSKQASAEKISHEFITKYFLEYKWLKKLKENYFARPAHFFRRNRKKKPCDWEEGSGDGFIKEHFKRDGKHVRPTEQASQTFVKPCPRS